MRINKGEILMKLRVKTEVIENYRKENRLTVEQFCKKCGISQKSYYKFVNGQLHIRITVLLKILHAMNIKYSDLIEDIYE